jgi:hypothetical protein
MRIHSDSLNRLHIERAVPETDVQVYIVSTHKSRTHRVAFEVALRGMGERHKRSPQGRVSTDPSNEKAATYDDWGHFLSALYEADHSMKVGNVYTCRAQFHSVTGNQYL